MIAVYLILLTAGVLVLQYGLAEWQKGQLSYEYQLDKLLAEPGQEITMTSTVKNFGRFPLLFVQLTEYFNRDLQICENQRGRYSRSKEYRADSSFMLLPYRMFSADITFRIPERGVYTVGRYYLQNGDYLGVASHVHSDELDKKSSSCPAAARIPT